MMKMKRKTEPRRSHPARGKLVKAMTTRMASQITTMVKTIAPHTSGTLYQGVLMILPAYTFLVRKSILRNLTVTPMRDAEWVTPLLVEGPVVRRMPVEVALRVLATTVLTHPVFRIGVPFGNLDDRGDVHQMDLRPWFQIARAGLDGKAVEESRHRFESLSVVHNSSLHQRGPTVKQ